MRPVIYLDTKGIDIDVWCGFDLDGFTEVQVEIQYPSGLKVMRPALVISQEQKVVRYNTRADDFTVRGFHTVQAVVDFGSNRRVRSSRLGISVR